MDKTSRTRVGGTTSIHHGIIVRSGVPGEVVVSVIRRYFKIPSGYRVTKVEMVRGYGTRKKEGRDLRQSAYTFKGVGLEVELSNPTTKRIHHYIMKEDGGMLADEYENCREEL